MASGYATTRKTAWLDGIRIRHGADGLKREFHSIAGGDRDKAAGMLNESAVRYPSLFVLQPEIVKHDLFDRLNPRNRFALDLTGGVLAGSLSNTYTPKPEDHEHIHWMFDTGYANDGLNDQYDEVMDKTALLLSRVYGDRLCLKPMEELMFRRNRKGAYIYDLVWAYFESSRPEDLIRLSQRLRSHDPKDVELARKLLNFVPCIEANIERSPEKLWRCTAEWLRRNRRRLVYTGESMQMKGNPRRYALAGAGEEARGDD